MMMARIQGQGTALVGREASIYLGSPGFPKLIGQPNSPTTCHWSGSLQNRDLRLRGTSPRSWGTGCLGEKGLSRGTEASETVGLLSVLQCI